MLGRIRVCMWPMFRINSVFSKIPNNWLLFVLNAKVGLIKPI